MQNKKAPRHSEGLNDRGIIPISAEIFKNNPRLITAENLGDMLSLGRSKVYDMKASGLLPRPIKLGRSVRWRLSDIESWINAGCPSQEKFEKLRGAK